MGVTGKESSRGLLTRQAEPEPRRAAGSGSPPRPRGRDAPTGRQRSRSRRLNAGTPDRPPRNRAWRLEADDAEIAVRLLAEDTIANTLRTATATSGSPAVGPYALHDIWGGFGGV